MRKLMQTRAMPREQLFDEFDDIPFTFEASVEVNVSFQYIRW